MREPIQELLENGATNLEIELSENVIRLQVEKAALLDALQVVHYEFEALVAEVAALIPPEKYIELLIKHDNHKRVRDITSAACIKATGKNWHELPTPRFAKAEGRDA